jgi:hypothetical protein
MAKKIDIRKVTLPDCCYYESVSDVIAETFIGRLKGITEAGKQALLQRKPFCRLMRKLVKGLQSNEVPDKAALMDEFGLPGRVYNLALLHAEAVIKSAIESQKAALEDVEVDINRQAVETFHSPSKELHGRIRKLLRLYKKRNRLLAQQGHPHIHFGRRFYQDQEANGWKAAYEAARNDRIGSLGSKDEKGGNSTYQIRAVQVEGKLRLELWHAQERMGWFKLKPQ